MIINTIGGKSTYSVTGTDSTKEHSGNLKDKEYAIVDPPGKEPFQVCLDGSINLTGITLKDVLITRYWGGGGVNEGWKSAISLLQK